MTRLPRRAPTSIRTLLGVVAGVYGFLFAVHVVNATDHSYTAGANGIVVTVAPDAATNYASLAHAKTGHSWAAGETITLAPGTYLSNTNGGTTFQFGAGKSGANYSKLEGNGATITYTGSLSSTGVIEVNTSGVIIQNVTLRNLGTNGNVFRCDGSTSAISDLYCRNITAQQANTNAASMVILKTTGAAAAVSATFENCVFEYPYVGTNGTRDTFGYGDGTSPYSSVNGKIYLINCRMGGCVYGANVSDNVVSCDGNGEIVISGGVYHDSDGPVMLVVNGTPRYGRIIVDGAEIYGSARGNVAAETAGAWVAGISNSYIHDCYTGIQLVPGAIDVGTDFSTNQTAGYFPSGTVWATGNVILRKSPAGEVGTDVSAMWYGIQAASTAKNVIINDNYLDGVVPWCNSNSGNMTVGIMACTTNNSYGSVSHNLVKNYFRGIATTAYSNIAIECDGNTVIGSPAYTASTYGAAFYLSAAAANRGYARVTNNLTNWTPTGAVTVNFYWNNFALDGRSGWNYLYSPTLSNHYFPATGWPATDAGSNTVGSPNNVAAPSLDAFGVPVAGTTAATWGAHNPDALTAYNTNGRFKLGMVDVYTDGSTNLNTNSAFMTDLATNGITSTYTYSTLLMVPNDASTENDGEWRVVTAEANSNATKIITVKPPFASIPIVGRKFVILPPAYPFVGAMSSYAPQHIEILPNGGPWTRRRDAFGRLSQPAFVGVSGTPASFGRGNTGWLNTATRWPELYRRIVGVPEPGRPSSLRPSNRRP